MLCAVPFELSETRWQRTTTQDDSRQECWFNGFSWMHQPTNFLDFLSGWPFFWFWEDCHKGGSGSAPTTHRSWAFGLTFSRFNCALSSGRLVYWPRKLVHVHDNEMARHTTHFNNLKNATFLGFLALWLSFLWSSEFVYLVDGHVWNAQTLQPPAIAGCICAFFGDELEKGQATRELWYNTDTTVVICWEVKIHAGNVSNNGSRFECVCFCEFKATLPIPPPRK